jgi:hypothetical protein
LCEIHQYYFRCIKWEIFQYKSEENELLKQEFFYTTSLCAQKVNILTGVLTGLQQSTSVHRKSLYLGTSYPRDTAAALPVVIAVAVG